MSDTSVFIPVNELERVLARAKAGEVPVPQLLELMTRSEVVLLVDKEVGEGGWDGSANPLILTTREGGPGICIFTSMERPAVWLQRFPAFEYGVVVDFAWLVKGVQPGTALLLNPGWDEGLAIAPTAVQEMRRAAETAEAADSADGAA